MDEMLFLVVLALLSFIVVPGWVVVFRLLRTRETVAGVTREAEMWKRKWGSAMAKNKELRGYMKGVQASADVDDDEDEEEEPDAEDSVEGVVSGVAEGMGIPKGQALRIWRAAEAGDPQAQQVVLKVVDEMKKRMGKGQEQAGGESASYV